MEQLKNLELPFTLDAQIPFLYAKVQIMKDGQEEVLLDLTEDTVKPSDVRKGVIFHKPNGEKAVGTLEL